MEIIWILPSILLVLGLVVWRLSRQPRLTKDQFYKSLNQLKATQPLEPNHGLIDSHKVFIAALATLYPQKNLNAAALIKRIAKRIPNEKVIWKLHRARNQAAHEPNFEVYAQTASQAVREFERALNALR